jgi:beta-phosphoglucomutase
VRGFVFDLDGVLTDTAEYHYRAWQRLADEEALPFDRAANEHLRGVSRRESLLLILQGRVIPEPQLEAMLARKNGYYLEAIKAITPADVLPGARELLEEIRAAKLKIALGSASKNAAEVVERLGIGPLLDAVADGYSVSDPKPAPALFWYAAGQLGLAPASVVVVEDAAAGVTAALNGGFRSVGLGPSERVGAAEVVFPSLAGVTLPKILNALAHA